ncbi:MAG: CBS domain-containing protein [Planctomycetota bacterium]|nr:CBS domain-containing protein [Planctomycetota bacterium]
MLVRYFMTPTVRTLEASLSCADAWQCFQRDGLRRAPVVEGNRVLGLITDRDLVRILPRTVSDVDGLASIDALDKTIGECVNPNLIYVEPNDHLETAARKLLENRIGGLPVIYEGRLKGIITESDLFRVFVKLKHDSEATRLTLHWPANHGESQMPTRIALATGVRWISHCPAGGRRKHWRVRHQTSRSRLPPHRPGRSRGFKVSGVNWRVRAV